MRQAAAALAANPAARAGFVESGALKAVLELGESADGCLPPSPSSDGPGLLRSFCPLPDWRTKS